MINLNQCFVVMKTSENQEKKQLRELSEEELKEVTGGSSIDCSQPENRVLPICKDRRVIVDLARMEKGMPQL